MDEQAIAKLREFFSTYKKISYKKNEIILRAEDTPSGVYFIESGYVREYSVSPKGDELTLFTYKPTDVFPLIWAVTNFTNTKYFESYTDSVVIRAPQEAFLSFLRENPELLFSLTNYILFRMGLFSDKMEQLVYGNASSKLAHALLVLVQRYGQEENGIWKVTIPFTHKEIGAIIGSTRETVSVEMQKLIKQGIITHESQLLTVLDIEYLKNASQIK